jgi:hypothetical protein
MTSSSAKWDAEDEDGVMVRSDNRELKLELELSFAGRREGRERDGAPS